MQLDRAEQDLFNRCWDAMRGPICGDISSSTYEGTCRRSAARDYTELAAGAPRDEYLIANGCPVSMVHPAEANAAATQPAP